MSDEPRPDPAGVQAAIDRYRDLAKYLITIFAGVGAVLVAGTQLASIGKLSLGHDLDRVVAVVAGLVLAVASIAVIVALALRILRPIEMSLDEVAGDPKLRAAIEQRRSLLGGAQDVGEVQRNVATAAAFPDGDAASWATVADEIVAEAAYQRMRTTFEGTWSPLLLAAVVGVLGITAFAWGANPPDEPSGSAAVVRRAPTGVRPTPTAVRISLTATGRQALTDALGGRRCTQGTIAGLALGGTASSPRVVTLPRRRCKVAQLLLTPAWGAATSATAAPAAPASRRKSTP